MGALVPTAAQAASKDDKANGSGRVALGEGFWADFSVTANSEPDAAVSARGNLNFRNGDPGFDSAKADVVCIYVRDNEAVIVGS
jgi:hypothetical protein